MGEVIRKSAAAIDIMADVRATLANTRARGGDWQSLAESKLAPLMPLVDSVEARLAAAEAELVPLLAAVHARDDEADRLLGRSRACPRPKPRPTRRRSAPAQRHSVMRWTPQRSQPHGLSC